MCDYSLLSVRNRLAEEGEMLVVHRFHTGSKGLASPSTRNGDGKRENLVKMIWKAMFSVPKECAVCIPDGARLTVFGIPPHLQRTHRLEPCEIATFRQLSMSSETYRDAVEFTNGVTLRLQDLETGQHVRVLSLSSMEVPAPEEASALHQ